MFLGKNVYLLNEAITEHSRAMAIEVLIFVFGVVWVVGWYLKWTLSGLPIDSSVCYLGAIWVSGILGCECDSSVCDLRTSAYFRALGACLVPYEWVAAGSSLVGTIWMSRSWATKMCLAPLCYDGSLCESCLDFL